MYTSSLAEGDYVFQLRKESKRLAIGKLEFQIMFDFDTSKAGEG